MRRTAGLLMLAACSSGPIALHAPSVAPSVAREPTPVEIEPIAAKAGAVAGEWAAPGPEAVLTAAMTAEVAGRAAHGGEPGGYALRCTLDRFAVRSRGVMTESEQTIVLYADLSCEARRAHDGAVVWRGELRGRTCEAAGDVLGADTGSTQRLVDRALSDAAREMTGDLLLRGLALVAEPSARVFADEAQQRAVAGLDDAPFGPIALTENSAALEPAMRAAADLDAATRAAAWNAIAMASGPGDLWVAGDKMRLDGAPIVRFAQYKALARLATPTAMDQLRAAAAQEDDQLLLEMLHDAIASGGIGLARSKRAR